MTTYTGRWHGPQRYFGLHYDLHANATDTELGARATPKELVPLLKLLNPDFVQTDCKGHPGHTSWYSQVPGATVSPGVKRDALKGWRQATAQLDLPLHCHYSGIWDDAAGEKHPEWCRVDAEGKPVPGRMCPRGPYLEQLMLPQLIELIDRYRIDGFWVDGEIWAVEPCYCERCRAAFTQATGIAQPPKEPGEADWPAWFEFSLQSFEAHVTRYCETIHAQRPTALLCSNWLQTFRHPGEPKVPTDWISGDNTWVFGLDGCRCESRFISTRGKPWDIMIWSFYAAQGMGQVESPWTFKPVQMVQQEAAVVVALGGSVQVYEHPAGLRNGQLAPWRCQRLRQVGQFVRQRRALCQATQTVPQVAVLHSEHHARSRPGRNLMWGIDHSPVQGAVYSLLEVHYNVDILDEWALAQRLEEFPVVVAPEQDRMSAEMVERLKAYVQRGGKLLLSGAAGLERFGAGFLGVKAGVHQEKQTCHLPVADGSLPVYSEEWQLLKPGKARGLGRLGLSALLDERLLPHPAATLHQVGEGAVAYIPFGLFRFFDKNRYPLARAFAAEVMEELVGELPIRVEGPLCVDAVLRRKGRRLLVHLINRASGIPNRPNDGSVDQIPLVGLVRVEVEMEKRPKKVQLAFEKGKLKWSWKAGLLAVQLDQVHIHVAIVVD
ncbi:MAG: beta-galactosidase trimerization domain-containing protein [Candidatus Latescibacteria bacterium]|nr:beta-galactosidase trimerization domain-containing protein [Candidatus Latescibacterota bacterium]